MSRYIVSLLITIVVYASLISTLFLFGNNSCKSFDKKTKVVKVAILQETIKKEKKIDNTNKNKEETQKQELSEEKEVTKTEEVIKKEEKKEEVTKTEKLKEEKKEEITKTEEVIKKEKKITKKEPKKLKSIKKAKPKKVAKKSRKKPSKTKVAKAKKRVKKSNKKSKHYAKKTSKKASKKVSKKHFNKSSSKSNSKYSKTNSITKSPIDYSLRDSYFQKIRAVINSNKHYPRVARRSGIEGRVEVVFTISKEGSLISINSINGDSIFFSATKDAVYNSFPLPPPNGALNGSKTMTISLVYRLN